jgi:hypothetical protein
MIVAKLVIYRMESSEINKDLGVPFGPYYSYYGCEFQGMFPHNLSTTHPPTPWNFDPPAPVDEHQFYLHGCRGWPKTRRWFGHWGKAAITQYKHWGFKLWQFKVEEFAVCTPDSAQVLFDFRFAERVKQVHLDSLLETKPSFVV